MKLNIKNSGLSILLGSSMLIQGCSTTSESSKPVKQTAVDRAIGKCVGSVAISTIGGALIGAAFGGQSGARQGAVVGAVVGVGRCVVLLDLAADEDKRQLQAAELAALELDQTRTSSIITKSGKSAQLTTKVTPAPPPAKAKPKPKKVAKKAEPEVKKPAPDVSENAEDTTEEAVLTAESQSDQQQGANLVEAKSAGASEQVDEASTISELAYFEEKPDTTVCRFTELFISIDGKTADTDKQKWCRGGDGSWQPVEG
ncbi:MAG: hypothetical protein WBD01_02780 [Salaquimonas sp.]